jgi:predicted ferric reductase
MPPAAPVENEYESSINIQFLLTILIAMILGLLAATLLLPTWLPNMATSLTGTDPKVFWYLSRATAFVSLTILWLSMALGLGLTNKMARLWPGAPASFAIHEYVSLLGLAFAVFHGLILLGDHYINFTVVQILMPFSTLDYRPTWTGIGQLAFYLWLIVALSFYVRSSIGQKTWRTIHYLSFALYVMALAHGLFAGTDSSQSWAQWYYGISAGSLLFLLIYRIVNTITEKLMKPTTRRVASPTKTPPLPGTATKPATVPVQTPAQK